ncbi:FAD-dependent oxidoreductase [Parasphingorhabdus cellanae]|uniref:NADH:ubiquinone reductase (non-electrogenic) n=1 Tax=Parasphingorhabdus cellanae TaxID=2806553 RepID=A0ABX7T361_9SPHN|nr:FAD-dependent oxidoreductase [Parasphingorhabdus cellanae]QTD56005.1 FAD-dependent oxidoreductase [Parasphingorhabdus cellanae]
MTIDQAVLQEERLSPFLRVTLRIWVKTYRSIISLISPLFDLLVRLFVAQAIFRSGVVKLSDWDTALNLARFEYPVSWMAPETAAVVGVTIEIIAPILLLAGLFTRGAALAILTLLAISQIEYIPTDLNLWLIAISGWYVLRGAGGFSFDRAVAGGLGDSALPFARPVMGLFRFLTDKVAPVWLLAIRIWLAVTLLAVVGIIGLAGPDVFLPVKSFADINPALAVCLAVLLIIGLVVPVTGLMLILSLSTLAVMGLHPDLTFYPMLLFGLIAIFGAGYLSVDRMISGWLESNILFDRKYEDVPENWPHIVVVGAGFGGLACVGKLKNLPVRITLIDRHNYHLFQPLLYQIATAALSPADVATPIRGLFRNDGNVRVLLGEVSSIDSAKKTLTYGQNGLDYDHLVLATGASHSYFGKDEWAPFAPGLKTIEDGVSVRGHVLRAFERAESSNDSERVKRLLTFVIVGAGPTGVELAGAIAELAHHGLKDEFSRIDPAQAQIILVQSGDRILPAFPEELSAHAAASLSNLGVDIRLKSRVTDISADRVKIGDDMEIATETVLWAAGVIASPAGKWLEADTDRAGRVAVDDYMRVAGHENVFAIGDTAGSNAWDGNPVPGLAPAAKQAGAYVASYIQNQLLDDKQMAPFKYKHQGSLATIGRKSAVADFGFMKLHGALAWWLWGAVHVGFLSGMRNRIAVLVNWIWSYFTLQLGIRLITGKDSGA